MKPSTFAFVLFFLWIHSHAGAQTQHADSVQFLYQVCKEELASGLPRFCIGYIEAVGQFMATNGFERNRISAGDAEARQYLSEMALCPGSSIGVPSGGALIQAFLNLAEKHPEHWADHTLVGVVLALASTWPCY